MADEFSKMYPGLSLCPSFMKTYPKNYDREMKKDLLEEQMCLEAARAEIEEEKRKIEKEKREMEKERKWQKNIQEN